MDDNTDVNLGVHLAFMATNATRAENQCVCGFWVFGAAPSGVLSKGNAEQLLSTLAFDGTLPTRSGVCPSEAA